MRIVIYELHRRFESCYSAKNIAKSGKGILEREILFHIDFLTQKLK